MANIEDSITAAKDRIPNVTPTPPAFHTEATAYELKARLQWGEPGLTIVDVRDHQAFNDCRILGAVSMPIDQVVDMAQSTLSLKRNIYVYGATDEETARAAGMLRDAGFMKVAELKGGLGTWQEIYGPIEGRVPTGDVTRGSFNVADRLREYAHERAEEKKVKNS